MDKISLVAEDLARKFRSDYDYSMSEPIIIKSLLTKLRILTMYKPLSEDAYGLSTRSADKEDKFILVNSQSSKGRQHFTIAHELYHLYLDENPHPHICRKDGKKDKVEVMADAFASALLLPQEGVFKAIPTEEIKNRKVSLSTVFFPGAIFQSFTPVCAIQTETPEFYDRGDTAVDAQKNNSRCCPTIWEFREGCI